MQSKFPILILPNTKNFFVSIYKTSDSIILVINLILNDRFYLLIGQWLADDHSYHDNKTPSWKVTITTDKFCEFIYNDILNVELW